MVIGKDISQIKNIKDILDSQYSKIDRTTTSKDIYNEREVLLGLLDTYLSSIRDEFENRTKNIINSSLQSGEDANAAPFTRNVPETVSNIVWAKQMIQKVEQIISTAVNVLQDLPRFATLKSTSAALLEDLQSFQKERYEFWVQDMEEALEDSEQPLVLKMTGRLLEIDFKESGLLKVNYSEKLVTLLRETRQLSTMGFAIPKKIKEAAETAQRFHRHGVILNQVANFYNTVFNQIIPSQKGMLLEAAIAFEEIVKRANKGGAVTWNNSAEVETYIEKLQQAADRITSENRKLRKYHQLIGERVAALLNVDLLRHQDKWRDSVREIRNIMDALERQGYKNTKAWRIHWDHQIYKALEFQYKLSLESLNESLTELSAELIYKQQQLQFRPSFEELKFKYYSAMKKCIKYPFQFYGVGDSDVYKHMAERNAASLIVVYKKAEDLFRRLAEEKEQFEEWVVLGSIDLDAYCEEHLKEVADWELNFKMLKLRGREAEKLPLEKKIDCISLSFAPVKSTIDDIMQRFADALVNSLKKAIQKHLNELDEFVTNAIALLSKKPTTVDEITQATQHYKQLLDQKPSMKILFDRAETKNKFLRSVAGGGVNLALVQNKWENFEVSMQYHELMVKEQLEALKAGVGDRIANFNVELERFLATWNEIKPVKVAIQDTETARTILLSMRDIKAQFTVLQKNADSIQADCKTFEMAAPSFPAIDTLEEEIQRYEHAWDLYELFTAELDALVTENWFSIRNKLHTFEDFVGNWNDRLKGMGKDSVSLYLRNEVEKYRELIPILKYVRGDTFTDEHWHELFRLLDIERGVPVAELSLKHFIAVSDRILKYADQVKELNARAQGEVTIREALQELKSWAIDAEFTLIEHAENGKNTHLIREWKEIMTQVGDNQSLVQSLKDSPYFKLFMDEANIWEQKLSALSEYLLKLNNVQRRWVYLEPIFGRGALPQEQARFNKVDTAFRSIMAYVHSEKKVITLVNYPSIRDTLNVLVDQLERCQKALTEFLETKRAGFPRFYFIGDDDLLEILGQAKNPAVIQSHLKKLFQGIHSVEFSSNYRQIVAMKSSIGEVVPLLTAVSITDRVEEWLSNLATEMKSTLKLLLVRCLEVNDIANFPSQILQTAGAIEFTKRCEIAIAKGQLHELNTELRNELASYTSYDAGNDEVTRSKLKALILDIIHNMDVVDQLIRAGTDDVNHWTWQRQLRFYMDSSRTCKIRMADAEFEYTYEYQGNAPKLVHTPLTDKCYLTLTQAMANGYGGNPYGPAGTGKTGSSLLSFALVLIVHLAESVKALGQLFARQVLVFNCDEGIDFKSMGRIFTGIVKCGAWGCFDEFNRLDEEVLSAVSQQIQVIQSALKNKEQTMVLMGTSISVDPNSGIFVTLNPAGKGYGGRSKLPDNLKQLFRSVAMSAPDLEQIAEVILYSEGFTNAREFGQKLVSIFQLCKQLLTPQQHYDWGLRGLKTILNCGGQYLQKERRTNKNVTVDTERELILQALRVNTLSKLTFSDSHRFNALVEDVFPGSAPKDVGYDKLEAEIKNTLTEMKLDYLPAQVRKILQFYEALNQRMGVVIVGPGGCGKSTLWRVLRAALLKLKKRVTQYNINPKAMPRQQLLGHMDLDTREWFDGVLTVAARSAVKEAADVDSWIICDGDIDPEWIESLNSVLDDNRLLTMPNGERIQFGTNINFIFETHSLKWASPATVSRMGMIFLADEDMDSKALVNAWLRSMPEENRSKLSGWIDSYFYRALNWITTERSAAVETTLGGTILTGLSQLSEAATKGEFIIGLIRGLGCNLDIEKRASFAQNVFAWAGESPVDPKRPLNCFYDAKTMSFRSYESELAVEYSIHQIVKQPVVPTLDIRSNADILLPWLRQGDPFLIVGPEGCGKGSILQYCFSQVKSTSVATLHCNSQTTAVHVIQKLNQACNVFSSTKGRVLRPKEGEKLILYLKDINLPKPDKYETIQLIALLQQLIAYEGFYDENLEWLGIERVQIVASMTSSNTVGRYPLTTRFTALMRICYVAYPSREQLQSIYSTYLDAVLSNLSHATWSSKPNRQKLASCIVDIYEQIKSKFTSDEYSHYIFTPRDITKWVLGLLRYDLEANELLEVVVYEAQRLFRDRFVEKNAQQTYDRIVESVLKSQWNTVPNIADVYFSSFGNTQDGVKWGKRLTKITADDFKEFIAKGISAFERENRDLNILLFSNVLDHVARVDRMLSRPNGSLLLVGTPGVGRRSSVVLTAFMHGITLFTPKMSRYYTIKNFRADLKQVIQKAGLEGEYVALFLEDFQLMTPEYLEIINSLLSSGEVPGLYTPEELEPILAPLKDKMVEEVFSGSVFQFFVERVKKNLHIILSMNYDNDQFQMRCESNPALFTQCNIQWWSTWSADVMKYIPYALLKQTFPELSVADAMIKQIVQIHESCVAALKATPREYITFLHSYQAIYNKKKASALEQQSHLQGGLSKLSDAAQVVDVLSQEASNKKVLLAKKQAEVNQALSDITQSVENSSDQRKEMKTLEEKLGEERLQMESRKKEIEDKLSNIQPTLDKAREAVGSVNPKNITEIKSFSNPPKAIVDVFTAVLAILGKFDPTWNEIKIFLGTAKEQLLNFDVRKVTAKGRTVVGELLKTKASSFDEAIIINASKAAAPMAAWVKAVFEYSTVLDSIAPMEKDLAKLTKNLVASEKRVQNLKDVLTELDAKIEQLKADLNSKSEEASFLKVDLQQTESTLAAAQSLFSKLGNEKERWEQTIAEISKSLESLPSNALVAAAFVTYLGSTTEDVRRTMVLNWLSIVRLPASWSFKQFMSTESELLVLKAEGLPADDLSMENSILIQESQMCCFIVDPSTQATEWLKKHFAEKKVEVTTQDDARFMNTLELAVRFGKTLIIEEIDQIHPVLYPILRHDLEKQGTRNCIQIGEKSIDYHENFKLYLITRHSNLALPPDALALLCRINFTTTRSGLEGQLLSITLKHEKPQLEEKKNELLLLEEDQKVQLGALEKKLLVELASSEGNILENTQLLNSLNETKSKSILISNSLAESKQLQASLDKERNLYQKIASDGSALYFLLLDLQKANNMYQFSLGVFLKLFQRALQKDANQGNILIDQRINQVCTQLQKLTYEFISRSLFKADRLMFGLHMCHVMYPKLFAEQEWELFLGKIIVDVNDKAAECPPWIPADRRAAFNVLNATLPKVLQALSLKDSEAWSVWIKSPTCENEFPMKYVKKVSAFQRLLLIQALRPDRLESAMNAFVCELLGLKTLAPPPLNLSKVYSEESAPTEPILLIISPGTDPSQELEDLAIKVVGKENYHQIAMGQGQAEIALSILRNAAEHGWWLCLKNLHLAISWLPTLEKELNALNPHENFRLWCTTEPHLKFSSILLKSSLKITFEAPPGVKKNLQRTYESWTPEYITKGSPVRAQALFVLAWFHAIIQERRTFIPQGWTKFYEFSFADLRSSADIIDKYCNSSMGMIDWPVIHGLLENAIYGGRVDNEYDLRVLRTYLQLYFSNDIIGRNPQRKLNRAITLPPTQQFESFTELIAQLSDTDTPQYFYLPQNIDRSLQKTNSALVLNQLKLLNISLDIGSRFNRDKWGKELSPILNLWNKLCQSNSTLLNTPKITATNDTPIETFVRMENERAHELIKHVNSCFQNIQKVINGTLLLSADIAKIGIALLQGTVPDSWSNIWEGPQDAFSWLQAVVAKTVALDQWIEKLNSGTLLKSSLDLSELLRPEIFFNALRQQTARMTKCPIDKLQLISTNDPKLTANCALPITCTGFMLQGAAFDGTKLTETHSESPIHVNIGKYIVAWIPLNEPPPYPPTSTISCPLYYSSSRQLVQFSTRALTMHAGKSLF